MAPSKYASILPGLPLLQPADVPYQARVEEEKQKLAGLDAINLAWKYVRLRQEKARLAAEEKALNLSLEACTQLLVTSQDSGEEAWGQYGVKENALRLPNGDTIRVQSEPYGQVRDKEAFRLWCIANGYEQQLQLWPTTMNAIVKERAAAGEPYPDGTEAFRKDSLVFTPSKGEPE